LQQQNEHPTIIFKAVLISFLQTVQYQRKEGYIQKYKV